MTQYVEKIQPDVQMYAVLASEEEDFTGDLVLGQYEAASPIEAVLKFHDMIGYDSHKHFGVVLASEVRWFSPAPQLAETDSPASSEKAS